MRFLRRKTFSKARVMSEADSTNLVTLSRGERMLAPLSQPAQYTDPIGRHHRPFYADYEVAKSHINQMVGSMDHFEVFARQVIVGVFTRPNVTPKGFFLPVSEIKEDWWQHKVVLLLKAGPEAFKGDDEGTYHRATFGDHAAPAVGDWLIMNASSGMQINWCGDGASRPQGKDHAGRTVDLFEWDGWPCRIVADDCFLGRLTKPHNLV